MDLSAFNDRVKNWGVTTRGAMVTTAQGLGISHRENSPNGVASLDKIKDKYKQRDGAIVKVSFTFPRSLIWPQKGAGKGRGGSRGSTWLDKYGNKKTTNPQSFGKMGTGGRTAKPFMNEVMSAPVGVDELATIAAEEIGSAVINNFKI